MLGLQLTQSVAGAAQAFSERRGQPLIEGGVFHVDDYGSDMAFMKEIGDSVRLLLGRQVAHRYVAGAVGEQNHQRQDVGMDDLFLQEGLIGEPQPGREGGLPTGMSARAFWAR